MLPEYLKYWGLAKPPFSLTPDPDMLYMSKQYQEGLIRLKYAVVSNKGGSLLISEQAGDGKTSLLARLRRELDVQYQGRCRVVFIDHPTLTANQMVVEIARQLGVRTNTTDKLTLLNDLRRFLLECHNRGEKCVVLLDEGQMLCHRPDLLQELRILLNFCVSDAFLLTFVLSGQKPLDEAIRAMPEFYQRLPVRFFLRNLNLEDTRELIRHRLKLAGNSPGREIFSEDGFSGIYNYSRGCPRIICSVADLALVIAHSRYSAQADFVAVSQACSDMNRTDGAYHYYYFLESFRETASGAASTESEPATAARCPGCDSPVQPDTRFCHNCGLKLAAGEDEGEPTAAGGDQNVVQSAGSPVEDSIKAEKTEQAEAEPSAETNVLESSSLPWPGSPIKFTLETGESENTAQRPEEAKSSKPDPSSQKRPSGEPAEAVRQTGREPLLKPPGEFHEPAEQPELRLAGSVPGQPDESAAGPAAQKPFRADDSAGAGSPVKCPFCGLAVSRTEAECPNCGERLKEKSAAAPPKEMREAGTEEPVIARPEDSGPVVEPGSSEDAPESVGGQAAKQPAAHRECPACSALTESPKDLFCPACGARLDGVSGEQELLEQVEKLSLRKCILSKSFLQSGRALDPGVDELLFFPLGRLGGRSAVLCFSAAESEESFTTRCGLIFTGTRLRFVFTDGLKDLDYELIERVRVGEIKEKGTPLLSQLILETHTETNRIILPFRFNVARRLAESLESFIAQKIKVRRTSFSGQGVPTVKEVKKRNVR